jgi:hypothetical protein
MQISRARRKDIGEALSSGAFRVGKAQGHCHCHGLAKLPWRNPIRHKISANSLKIPGAGEAIRTPDPNLGKVMLYP